MYYPNYYPYNMNYSNYYSNFNNGNKKDTVSNNTETIPFKDFNVNNDIENNNINISADTEITETRSFKLFGLSLEIDDLILIGIIILLFLESDKNYTLIIILGLILLNVNLSDIFNLF